MEGVEIRDVGGLEWHALELDDLIKASERSAMTVGVTCRV